MKPETTNIAHALHAVRGEIDAHAREFGRDPRDIRLVAVSKTRPPADIAAAIAAGQRDFGENYLQEAVPKMDALRDSDVCWHFIGRIQSNKTRELATRFDWVHTLDRERIARRLNDQRPAALPPLDVCLQVNLDREPQKAGLDPDEVAPVARAVAALPRLRLRGLMAIPAPRENFAAQRAALTRLRECRDAVHALGIELDTLSMGMSDDLRAAIAAGSTLVRIGTAIFGKRP